MTSCSRRRCFNARGCRESEQRHNTRQQHWVHAQTASAALAHVSFSLKDSLRRKKASLITWQHVHVSSMNTYVSCSPSWSRPSRRLCIQRTPRHCIRAVASWSRHTGAAGVVALVALTAPDAALAAMHAEPANALSVPTWAVHVASVAEWLVAMDLLWRYGEATGRPAWKVCATSPRLCLALR